jgi:serine/threonine-protein kinase
VASAVVVAALVAIAAVLVARSGVFTPSHPVPALVGKSLAQADRAVGADHFKVQPTAHAYNLTLGEGLILKQTPAPGRKGKKVVTAKQGSTIDVVVSLGPPPVTIPALASDSIANCSQAVLVLKAANLVGVCPPAAAQYSSSVPLGAVIATSPAKTARYGSTVTIIVSKGHAPVLVPTVTGSTSSYATAQATLTAAGFAPTESRQYSSTVPAGQVMGTTPAPSAGPQPFGSPVTVAVSIGPQPVMVPDVIGHSVTAAANTLEALGLRVAGPYGPPHSTKVQSTAPAAGSSVLPGTTVDLYTR